MNIGDRVRLVRNVGVFPTGCKGVVSYIGGDGYVNVSLDEDEDGNEITPPVPLPPAPKNKFLVIILQDDIGE